MPEVKGLKKGSLLTRLALTPIRVITYAVLAFVVLMGVILFAVFRDRINDKTLSSVFNVFELSGSSGSTTSIMIDANPKNQYGLYQERLAVLSPERLVLYDKRGVESASTAIHMEKPALRTEHNTVIAFDRGGKTCIVAKEKEIEANYEFGYITTAALSQNDSYAVAVVESGYRGVVYVYDTAHYNYFRWYSAESGYVQDIALDPSASVLAVAAVRQEQEQLYSRLILHKTNRDQAEAVVDIPGQLILSISFLGKDRLCVILEYEIRFYKSDGTWLQTVPLEGRDYLGVKFSDELCALRTGRQGSEYHSMLTLIGRGGDVLGDIALEDYPVDDFDAAGEYTGILQNSTLSLYNDKAVICFSQENLSGYKKLLISPNGSVLLIAQDQAVWIR